jgi:hypothetical protein
VFLFAQTRYLRRVNFLKEAESAMSVPPSAIESKMKIVAKFPADIFLVMFPGLAGVLDARRIEGPSVAAAEPGL